MLKDVLFIAIERKSHPVSRAIGMVEFKTISAGVTAADAMVKAAAVELIEAQAVCPGKYIAVIKNIEIIITTINVFNKAFNIFFLSN